jgi:hypothetical protein
LVGNGCGCNGGNVVGNGCGCNGGNVVGNGCGCNSTVAPAATTPAAPAAPAAQPQPTSGAYNTQRAPVVDPNAFIIRGANYSNNN